MRVLDIFSGIGGFSIGLERAGMETVAFCEIEPFAVSVLQNNWPGVPIYEDITTASFESVGAVDMVTAGFPCQDASLAGKGAGIAGERTGLFWHILRTVRLVGRPKLLLENVAALLDRGMGTVLGALAQVGYDTEWSCIPAAAVGAPHSRDRVWIFANPGEAGRERPFLDWDSVCCVSRQEVAQLGDYRAICGDEWAANFPLVSVGDGIPSRLVREIIGAAGNAVVPQIPKMIGRAIMQDHFRNATK